MLWNIKAAENLISGDFGEFIKDGDGNLSCKKALELGSITAIAARDIAEGRNAHIKISVDRTLGGLSLSEK